jgi:hypothetical protein
VLIASFPDCVLNSPRICASISCKLPSVGVGREIGFWNGSVGRSSDRASSMERSHQWLTRGQMHSTSNRKYDVPGPPIASNCSCILCTNFLFHRSTGVLSVGCWLSEYKPYDSTSFRFLKTKGHINTVTRLCPNYEGI